SQKQTSGDRLWDHCVSVLSTRRCPWASGCCMAQSCSLNFSNVDTAHGHHGVHRPLRGGAIRILQRGNQGSRHDLPRKAPAVLAPAALAFAAAILDNRIPVAVGLCLIVGPYQEAHRPVLRERTDRRLPLIAVRWV